MKPAVKNAVESALVAGAVGITCLWFLVQAANVGAEDLDTAKVTLLALGLGASVAVHIVFMAQAVVRDGRRLLPWLAALIVALPVASVVLLVLLYEKTTPAAVE
ncbi:MAG TPA: hypothetical protein VGM81_00350 [Burkholderiaceae bacterium]|jgi:hypothetical protein